MYLKKISLAICSFLILSIANAQGKNSTKIYDFSFVDTSGYNHSLKEYSGKYIYLDIWASWCYPCRKEYPLLEKLRNSIDSNKVQIVSLSIDQTKFRWQGALGGYHMSGTQWCVNDTTFEKAYNVYRIPRFLLIDPEGNMINEEMTRPSDSTTEAYLKKL